MMRRKGQSAWLISALAATAVGLLAAVFWTGTKVASADPWVRDSAALAAPRTTVPVYIPAIFKDNKRRLPSNFGIEFYPFQDGGEKDKAIATDVYWVRVDAFKWNRIEPTDTNPATYKWGQVDEASLARLASSNLRTIAMVKYAPDWALKTPGDKRCGPIAQDKFDDFADFLTALVQRYSQPPYNVLYYELGNEPDVASSLVTATSPYGCWGDDGDAYYGGGYYGQMLKEAYLAVKAGNPQAQVLIGGLLLDCDPTNPPSGKDCKTARFLEGILRQNQGDANYPYFDIVSFHGYPYYQGGKIVDENFQTWKHRGGVVIGKVDFLREVLGNFGISKPLLHSEGALTCPEWNTSECNSPGPSPAFFEAQADYVVWLFVRNQVEGLLGTIWYPFPGEGWRYSGMLGSPAAPKPAYQVFDFLSEYFTGAVYTAHVGKYPLLRGFAFSKNGQAVWVLWSPDGSAHQITLPANYTRVLDKYGTDITPAQAKISVGSPIFVEFGP